MNAFVCVPQGGNEMADATEASTGQGQMRVDEVVARMVRARAELEGVLGRLSAEQLEAPGPEDWAIKDHLVHLELWARSIIDLLDSRPRYARLGLSDYAEFKATSMDDLNERIYEENRGRSVADVLARFRESHQQFVDKVRGLSDADLQRPYTSFSAEDRPDGNNPILNWIAADSYEHDEEHLGWIKEQFGLS
jgi:hypothetical protein